MNAKSCINFAAKQALKGKVLDKNQSNNYLFESDLLEQKLETVDATFWGKFWTYWATFYSNIVRFRNSWDLHLPKLVYIGTTISYIDIEWKPTLA